MNQEAFNKLLLNISDTKENPKDIIEKLIAFIDFIRPKNEDSLSQTKKSLDDIIEFFHQSNPVATEISDQINLLFLESKISANITSFGILSNNDFRYEFTERLYNKYLPNPPKKGDLDYIFTTLFNKKNDHLWIDAIEDEKWIEFFSALFGQSEKIKELKNYLFDELLYAAEILSIWIASEEFDPNFIRLDKKLLNKDSAFIALQRSIATYVSSIKSDSVSLEDIHLDFEHLGVLLEQCCEQVKILKKKSLHNGISIDLTYQLERLTQIIQRLEDIMDLIKNFDTPKAHLALIDLFKKAVKRNSTKNSLFQLYSQSIQIVARSITNNTSQSGDHYITSDHLGYLKMLLSAAGAGIVIAFMALLKINIVQAEFSSGIETLFASLNYGIGFVLIHLLGFTVATKQPAMTASSFAHAIEREEGKRTARKKRLVDLIFDVSRSQFAAVVGNVALALVVAFGIAFYFIQKDEVVFSAPEAHYYLASLEPFAALFFAAIAGVWLFLSGLISGYFDNRADLLELKERYYHQPLLKKILGNTKREKVANYLHEHHGAIAGNFFFGVLLGITPFIGLLLDLPLDIAHVAFSSAYLGYASMHLDLTLYEFFYYLSCALMIGAVNLAVSFSLALKVSLLSRDASLGNIFQFLKLLFVEILKKPHALIFPLSKEKEKE